MSEVMSAYVRFFVRDDVSSEVGRVESAAREAADGMDEAADAAGNNLSGALGKMQGIAKTSATALAAIGAAAGAALAGMFGLVESTKEYNGDMAALASNAAQTGNDLDQVKDQLADVYAMTGETDSAMEGLNNIMRTPVKGEMFDSAVQGLQGLSVAFRDTLKFEGIADSFQEMVNSGNFTGNLAEGLERLGYNADEVTAKLAGMTEEQRASYLVGLLQESGMMELANQYEEQNAALLQAEEASFRWQDAMAQAGLAFTPIVGAIQSFGAELLERALPYLQQFADWFMGSLPGIKESISNLGTQLQPFVDKLPLILGFVVAIAAAFAAYQAYSAILTAISAAQAIWAAVTATGAAKQWLLNAAMAANPIGILIALFAAIAAAVIYFWNTNDGFRAALTNAWEAISATASKVWGAIVNFFTVTIPEAITALMEWFSNLGANISLAFASAILAVTTFATNLLTSAQEAGSGFVAKIGEFMAKVPGKVTEFLSKIPGIIRGFATDMASAAYDMIAGMASGITDAGGAIMAAVSDLCSRALESVKSFFGIASPSKVFRRIFRWIPIGSAIGIDDEAQAPVNSLEKMGAAMQAASVKAAANVDINAMAEARPGASGAVAAGSVTEVTNTWNIKTGETDAAKLARMIAAEERQQAYELATA